MSADYRHAILEGATMVRVGPRSSVSARDKRPKPYDNRTDGLRPPRTIDSIAL